MTLSEALHTALTRFPGIALIGPRANSKTPDFAIPVPLPPNLPGLDARIARVESLPKGVTVPLVGGGSYIRWRERIEGSATVLETTTDGSPAILEAGPIRYLAGWPDAAALDRLLRKACADRHLPIDPMPEGLRRRDTATHSFLFNYGPEPVLHKSEVHLPASVRIEVKREP